MEWSVFILLMACTGIPHGATDHLVYKQLRQVQGIPVSWPRFFAQYLGLMLLYGFVWWLTPAIALLLFLGISFYHFGQSELFFIPLKESNWYKKSLYISWGAGIVLFILFWHLEETLVLLGELLNSERIGPSTLRRIIFIVLIGSGIWTLVGMAILGGKYPEIRRDLLLEIGGSIILVLLIRHQSLLIGFAMYFGLWHAGKTIWMEIQSFQSSHQSFHLKDWIWAAIPFSLMSLFGIGVLLWVANWDHLPFHPIVLFFIAVSMLTLPHINLVGSLYHKKSSLNF